MNLLFYTTWDFSNENTDGIAKKIKNEFSVFQKAGFQVSLTYFKNGHAFINNGNSQIDLGPVGLSRKFKANYLFAAYLKTHSYDAYYIRYGFSDFGFLKSLKNIKQHGNTKVIVEIPSYPYDAELKINFPYKIILLFDTLTRKRLLKYVDYIATYSLDKFIYGIQTINICNGIDVSSIRPSKQLEFSDSLNLIAVAGLSIWHGYDRLLEGIGQYYQNGGKKNIFFHIVGDGTEVEKYKQIINKYNIEHRVLLYGAKYGDELDNIYDKADIAVVSLGIHRLGLKRVSALKSKEYLAKGLPVITACDVDTFENKDYDFVLRFPADDSPIDVQKILDFYDHLFKGSLEKKQQYANTIRKIAEENCDMSKTMLPIINCFVNNP